MYIVLDKGYFLQIFGNIFFMTHTSQKVLQMNIHCSSEYISQASSDHLRSIYKRQLTSDCPFSDSISIAKLATVSAIAPTCMKAIFSCTQGHGTCKYPCLCTWCNLKTLQRCDPEYMNTLPYIKHFRNVHTVVTKISHMHEKLIWNCVLISYWV